MVSDEVNTYYGRVTRVFVERIDPAVVGEEPKAHELNDEELLGIDRYAPLASVFETHEWRILRDFCISRPDGARREQLLEAVPGTGAFRWTEAVI